MASQLDRDSIEDAKFGDIGAAFYDLKTVNRP
jgi:hypothetical protein